MFVEGAAVASAAEMGPLAAQEAAEAAVAAAAATVGRGENERRRDPNAYDPNGLSLL